MLQTRSSTPASSRVESRVESLLNSRPLATVSDDPNDEPVLKPNHFVIAQMGGDILPESVDMTEFNPRHRWRGVQELIRRVWQRWLREFLTYIGSRLKWFPKEVNLKEYDVVVVIDTKARRRDWKLGRVVRTYPGGDGLVRVVDVKVGDMILQRPASKLSPL